MANHLIENLVRETFLRKVFNYVGKQRWHYQGDRPCVIKFYDDSCPPCQVITQPIAELADEYHGRVLFYQVDVREEELARELGVWHLPTVVLCPLDGSPALAARKSRAFRWLSGMGPD